MTKLTLKFKGLDEFNRKLEQMPGAINRGLASTIAGAVEMLRGGLAKYPRATEANQPRAWNSVYSRRTRRPNNTWYERGYGSKWVVKSGEVRGRATSQTLGRSWTTQVKTLTNGIVGVVGTRASYARVVQDRDQQADYHAARGWPTAQGVLEEKTPKIRRLFEQMLARLWG